MHHYVRRWSLHDYSSHNCSVINIITKSKENFGGNQFNFNFVVCFSPAPFIMKKHSEVAHRCIILIKYDTWLFLYVIVGAYDDKKSVSVLNRDQIFLGIDQLSYWPSLLITSYRQAHLPTICPRRTLSIFKTLYIIFLNS